VALQPEQEAIMSLGNIIGNMLGNGTSRHSQDRLRTGAENAERSGGIEEILGSLMRGSGASGAGGGDLADRARDFLGKEQAGGMSGAKIGGLGAAAGALFGGGIGGAARGGAMAVLGTLALKAWRDHQSEQGGALQDAEPGQDDVRALTGPEAERLVLRAMIGAAQVDGHVDDAEMERILGRMHDDDVTEEDRRAAREDVRRPVDVEALGAQVSRPEVAMEIYLAALMAVDIDTEAERDYFRRLARALRLDANVVSRLHRMTGAPSPASAQS
jgi:uncharacterized membrane protein YebE (DUF533 family)